MGEVKKKPTIEELEAELAEAREISEDAKACRQVALGLPAGRAFNEFGGNIAGRLYTLKAKLAEANRTRDAKWAEAKTLRQQLATVTAERDELEVQIKKERGGSHFDALVERNAALEAVGERLKGELNRQWEIEQAVILGRAAEERGDHEGAEIYADNLTQVLRQKAEDGGSPLLCSSCAGLLRDDLAEGGGS